MDPSSQRKRRGRRKRQSRAAKSGSNTTIESLSDDVLRDIIVRLPTPTALGRAALACPRWRRLATSPDFLRRHRALHPSPPPLIGCFFNAIDGFPVFHRVANFRDDDLAAVVRGGDFSFTSFGDEWKLEDCLDGIFLLSRVTLSDARFALLDPVSRCCVRISIPDDHECEELVLCLLPSYSGDNVDDASFRVVSLNYDLDDVEAEEGEETGRVRADTYSSRTGEWRSHLCTPLLRYDEFCHSITDSNSWSQSMHAAGRIYWKNLRPGCSNSELLISFNTKTMEFSYVAPPPVPGLSNADGLYVVGDTEDGACCLVTVPTPEHDALQVWLRNEEEGSWELCWEIQESELQRCFSLSVPWKYRLLR